MKCMYFILFTIEREPLGCRVPSSSDNDVEAEVDQIEADEEVAQLYEDAKKRHRKIMTGGFKWIHVKDIEDTVYGI